jgi:4-amino-4-deoxy-L-arabinose transferase-like glycosyltransferase
LNCVLAQERRSCDSLRVVSPILAENQPSPLIQNSESKPPQMVVGQSAGVQEAQSRWREGWGAFAVLVLTAALYFIRLGSRALWASEFRWAEIAREMLLTHNYFWPTINGRLYFDKPLGSYWLVLAAAWVTGHMNEAATRIPGAAAGVMAVALLIVLGRRLYDFRTGLAAGFILATSFSFAFWARTASADVETIAGELGALLIFAKNENRSGWWVVPMWVVMALTSLMKGLLGFVLPILVIGVYSFVAGGWLEIRNHLMRGPLASRIQWLVERNRWFFNWKTSVALGLAAALYIAPFAISFALTKSASGIYMVYRENVERYFAAFDHRGPFYLYAYVIFALMAPWSVFLPAALVHAHNRTENSSTAALSVASHPHLACPAIGWKSDRQEQGREPVKSDRFVLAFFWTTFVFFTLSGSRRSYYLLPILPPASILVARLFLVAEARLTNASRILLKVGFVVAVSLMVLLALVLLGGRALLPPPYALLPGLPWPRTFTAFWVLSLGMAAYASVRYSRMHILLSVSITSYLLLFYLFMLALPAGDGWRGERRFAETTRQLIDGQSGQLASFKTGPPAFYLGLTRPVPEFDTATELDSAVRDGRIKWVIVRRRDIPDMGVPARERAFEPSYPWDSPEHRRNNLVLMRVDG